MPSSSFRLRLVFVVAAAAALVSCSVGAVRARAVLHGPTEWSVAQSGPASASTRLPGSQPPVATGPAAAVQAPGSPGPAPTAAAPAPGGTAPPPPQTRPDCRPHLMILCRLPTPPPA